MVKHLKNSTGRKQDEKVQLQAHATFHEEGRMTQWVEPKAQRVALRAMENYSQTWKHIKKHMSSQISELLQTSDSYKPCIYCILEQQYVSILCLPLLYAGCVEVRYVDTLVSQIYRWRGTVLEKLYLRNTTQGTSSTSISNIDAFWILVWCLLIL